MANPFVQQDAGDLCIKVGDREPSWLFRLRRGDANKTPVPIDTQGVGDIKIRIRLKSSTAPAVEFSVSEILDDGVDPDLVGVVRYDPTAADVDTKGIYLVEIKTSRAGIEATFPVEGFFIVNIAKRA